ncbi:hypothetical protein AAEX28_09030 [Lentisphaerota bacterium WC36G]|nr:hypothetical protein LJT99_11880 [Lentisphaerae bacterium WC36]
MKNKKLVFVLSSIAVVFIVFSSLLAMHQYYSKKNYQETLKDLQKVGIATDCEKLYNLYPSTKGHDDNAFEFNKLINSVPDSKFDHLFIVGTYGNKIRYDHYGFLSSDVAKRQKSLDKIVAFTKKVDSINSTLMVFFEAKDCNNVDIKAFRQLGYNLRMAIIKACVNNDQEKAFKYLLTFKKIGAYYDSFFKFSFFDIYYKEYHNALKDYFFYFTPTESQLKSLADSTNVTNKFIIEQYQKSLTAGILEYSILEKEGLKTFYKSNTYNMVPSFLRGVTANLLSTQHEYILNEYYQAELKNFNKMKKDLSAGNFSYSKMDKHSDILFHKLFGFSLPYDVKLGHNMTIKRLGKIMIAIEQFKLKHKRKPQKLTELVPEFLTQRQILTLQGKPFNYEPNEVEVFLYSKKDNLDQLAKTKELLRKYFTKKLVYTEQNPQGFKDYKLVIEAVRKKIADVLKNGSDDIAVIEIIENQSIPKKEQKKSGYKISTDEIKKATGDLKEISIIVIDRKQKPIK